MAYKLDKINAAVAKDVAEIIQFETKDPEINFVTITKVSVTRDYSYAKIYVSFFDDIDVEAKMARLEKAKGFIRSRLAERLDMRKVPALIFVYDDSYEKGRKIDKIIEEIRNKER